MRFLSLITAVAFLFLLNSCVKDQCSKVMTYIKYEPVYISQEAIRAEPVMQIAQTLKQPGKMYLYGTTLLINEINEGIHFYDNTDPSNPLPLGFLRIPGNKEMAVVANILYADNYTDLIAIDISDVQNIRFRKRIENVYSYFDTDPDKGLVVRYEEKEVTEEVDCNFFPDQRNFIAANNSMNFNATSSTASGGGGSRELVGVGGSMARFAINGANLYVVDHSNLQVFDLSTPDNPVSVYQTMIGVNIETIFPYSNQLFIGSAIGMYIYDVSNPHLPVFRSVFEHAEVCDPVFVDGQYAYVTLRSGTECNGFVNQLDILDVSNLSQPVLLSSTTMQNPHGLTVYDNTLFLCEGASGFKVFDVNNKITGPQQSLFNDPSFFAFDALKIPGKDVVIVVGEDGFYQFDTQTPNALTLLSRIEIQP